MYDISTDVIVEIFQTSYFLLDLNIEPNMENDTMALEEGIHTSDDILVLPMSLLKYNIKFLI